MSLVAEPIEVPTLNVGLQNRFKFLRSSPLPLYLSNLAVPVYDISEFLESVKIETSGSFSRLAASGAGTVTAVTVPSGKRWIIYAIDIFRSTGDGTIDKVSIDATVQIYSQSASGGVKTELLNHSVILDENHNISVHVADITTDSTWDIRLYYVEREI